MKVAKNARDWMKVYAGAPVQSRPLGYPNVVYLSAPTPISTRFWPWLAPRYQTVQRSMDGGANWTEVARLSLDPRDGLRRGARLGLAISRDEGATWKVGDVPGSQLLRYWNITQVGFVNGNYVIGEPLALDQDGNLYALWPDHEDRLRLAVSRDQGKTFSEAVVVSAPEVTHVRYGAMAARSAGELAIAYYGSSDGRAYHGYIAESKNALDSMPVFVGATIHREDRPLYRHGFDPGYLGMFWGGDLNEYLQVKFAANGDIYASFCKVMRRGAERAGGWSHRGHARSKLQGILGRLAQRM